MTSHRQYTVPYAVPLSTEQRRKVQKGIESCCELRLGEQQLYNMDNISCAESDDPNIDVQMPNYTGNDIGVSCGRSRHL